ncbi:MAG: tRNA pseudouridine(55) synthase TruB [Acidobacteria bacterium]|nr:tRNA pseudouridine(55) synthase TruB [Acidobacteriota bacterium]
MDGVIVVNKSPDWTSHDVVAKMRRIAGTKKIGHLGTLDPMATGVLPLVLNKATRLAQFYMRSEKRYQALVRFGFATTTYDKEGERTSEPVQVDLSRTQIEEALAPFRGVLQQRPPAISAKKIAGTPAYKLARKNIEVDLPPVEVTVFSLDLLEAGPDWIRIDVHCSAGTYLRSLAHDLGQSLGCGAHLEELTRTASGDFTLAQARTLTELEALSKEGRLNEVIVPASQLLPQFPAEVVDQITATQIRQGRDFRVSPFRVAKGAQFVRAIDADGSLLAIGEVKLPNLYHPILVF